MGACRIKNKKRNKRKTLEPNKELCSHKAR